MQISKDKLMEVVNNPKVICWSDVLEYLGLISYFKEYYNKYNKRFDIRQITLGKTLLNIITDTLRERIKTTKDRRIKHLKGKYRLSNFEMDCLNSMPDQAKEDIDYMNLKDL